MPTKTYDPKDVVLTVGGNPIGGFADGTYITFTRTSDSWSSISGADGEVSRAKSNDRRGELTVTLAQTSLSNDVLSALAALDEATNGGVVPILLKDLAGTTTIFAGEGWIRKPADFERAKEISNNEWTFDLADSAVIIGGTAFNG